MVDLQFQVKQGWGIIHTLTTQGKKALHYLIPHLRYYAPPYNFKRVYSPPVWGIIDPVTHKFSVGVSLFLLRHLRLWQGHFPFQLECEYLPCHQYASVTEHMDAEIDCLMQCAQLQADQVKIFDLANEDSVSEWEDREKWEAIVLKISTRNNALLKKILNLCPGLRHCSYWWAFFSPGEDIPHWQWIQYHSFFSYPYEIKTRFPRVQQPIPTLLYRDTPTLINQCKLAYEQATANPESGGRWMIYAPTRRSMEAIGQDYEIDELNIYKGKKYYLSLDSLRLWRKEPSLFVTSSAILLQNSGILVLPFLEDWRIKHLQRVVLTGLHHGITEIWTTDSLPPAIASFPSFLPWTFVESTAPESPPESQHAR